MENTRPRIGALVAIYISVAVLGAVESIVASGLPILQREIGLTVADAALAMSIYGLAVLIALPIAGKLGDLYGAKLVVATCLALAAAGAALSAIAASMLVVAIAKILLAFGAAAVAPAVTLVRHASRAASSLAMGWYIGALALGGSLGAVLVGPLAEAFSQFATFMVPAAAQLVAMVLLLLLVPRHRAEKHDGRRFDFAGLVLFTISLLAFQSAISLSATSGWLSLPVLGLGALTVAALIVFVAVERRAAEPFFDLELLRIPAMLGSVLLGIVVGVAYSAGFFLLQQIVVLPATTKGPGMGLTFTAISLYTAPGIVLGIVSAPLTGWLMRLWGLRLVSVLGLISLVGGSVVLGLLHTEPWHIALASILIVGIGGAILYTVAMTGSEQAVSTDQVGISTAMVMTARGVGFIVGPLVLGALLGVASDVNGVPTNVGFLLSIGMTAIVGCLGLLCVRMLPGRANESISVTTAHAPERTS